jgi:RNA polymerase sigma-70 factor (ECF subfamily)
MSAADPLDESVPAGARQFVTTRWSMVVAAGGPSTSGARDALEKLCRTYWYPLYAFVRRQGHGPADAQDLTQAFFARIIEKHGLGGVDRAKGRFRSFLLASMKHFLANEWDRARAQKRGGGLQFTSLDAKSAETRYSLEPADPMTPEKIFDRRWALTLLDEVLSALRREYGVAGNAELFEALKGTLTAEADAAPYADVGRALGMSEGAVKVAVHRLRRRYREILRAEIAETVADPGEVEDELKHLVAVLSG